MTVAAYHQPVMLTEVIDKLRILSSGVYLDATCGDGGHSSAILQALGAEGRLVSLDRDPTAVAMTRKRLGDDARLQVNQSRFSQWDQVLKGLGVMQFDGILMDLGVSSRQLDEPERGFGYRLDAKLDMRMDPKQGKSAACWLKVAKREEMRRVFSEYGQFARSGLLAHRIVQQRKAKPVSRTLELTQMVESVMPASKVHRRRHPARQVFQAIRIHLNAELWELERALKLCLQFLKVGGRLVVLTFHSLEQRMVRRFFHRVVSPPWQPVFRYWDEVIKLMPSPDEIARNSRARSVQLHAATRQAEPSWLITTSA